MIVIKNMTMATEKKSLRQQYIDRIMKDKYGDDDPKYDSQNLAFLETLSLDELSNLASGEFGDEQELDGEVRDLPELNEY
jgi:hypothetical protein